MHCRYETFVRAACPVDSRADLYEATFESDRTIPVEVILKAIEECEPRKAFQEDIAADLARTLKCKVTLVGHHSGVKTTVIAP